jgi:hypothetical protein
MRIAILGILIAGLVQEDTGEQFFKFPVGTSWKLLQKDGDKETKIELQAAKHEEGKTFVESKEFRDEGEPKLTTLVWWAEGGHVIWGERRNEKVRPELRIYKLGSKKGDSWDASPGPGGPPDAKATHMGTVEKKVAAGTYKDALHVQLEFGGQKADMFFAPKVGIIRMEMLLEGKVAKSVELTEFKEGK